MYKKKFSFFMFFALFGSGYYLSSNFLLAKNIISFNFWVIIEIIILLLSIRYAIVKVKVELKNNNTNNSAKIDDYREDSNENEGKYDYNNESDEPISNQISDSRSMIDKPFEIDESLRIFDIELTDEFKKAFDLMENTNENIFITGKAGTGKSTLLEYFRNETNKKVVVLAPTGVAALNVRGQTIHSFFYFGPNITLNKVKKLYAENNKFNKLDVIIVDEVSMVRADLMDCVDKAMRLNCDDDRPFGGKQLILFGDLFQLPPVLKVEQAQIFADKYDSPYFFSAKSILKTKLYRLELNKVFRQKDEEFINILNHVRNNEIYDEILNRLNHNYKEDYNPSEDDLFIYLTTTNKIADDKNFNELNKLKTKLFEFKAEVEGAFSELKEEDYPADFILKVKIGSQVMMLTNDYHKRWANGSIGVVKKIDNDNKCITVIMKNNKQVDIAPYKWKLFDYVLNKDTNEIETKDIGSFQQIPMKLAWAVTIHKSQGKTFNNVALDIGQGAFTCGQTYVALSRCTSLDGIVLLKELSYDDIFVDSRIVEYMTTGKYQVSENKLSIEEKVKIIKKAIDNNQSLEIVYFTKDAKKSTRKISPFYIGNCDYEGHPFFGIKAYCHLRNEKRSFRIDRIERINNL